jgi:hypothetical protein
MKKQVVVEGTLEVPEDALHNCEMRLTRVVHVEEHLLDRVGNVKSGEGEILESPSQAVVGSRVADGCPHVGGDLGLSVDRRGAGFAAVGLTPTGVQRHETKSQARLFSRPDRGRQPTDDCGPLSCCAYTKGGEGLGAHMTKFAVTYFPLPHHPRTDH